MAKVMSEYDVEELYIERLVDMGYEFVPMKDYKDVCENFRKQFCKLNRSALIEGKGNDALSDREFDRVMLRLENHTIYESAKILREKWVLELDDGKSIYVEFLTPDETRNIYQVTHQVTMDPAHKDDVLYKNRYDVTILINGLPVIQTELKRPGVELNEAVNQINRYRRFSFRGLFRYIQIFIVSNSTMTKYAANIDDNNAFGNKQDILKALTFYWTDENNVRINKLIDFTNVFLQKVHITEMLTKYFIIKDTEPVLMVMRPYQIYAVKRAFDRIMMSNLNGYVFHTTGSGKTLTSFKLATLLRDDRRIDKVFFLIDRSDLDDQTVDEYNSFEAGCVDQTDSTYTLIKSMQDSSKTLIITTIQKMATALRTEKYSEIMDAFRDNKCVFIIDECHRSQFGKMNAQIKKHFQNANYIGFTGTPIFKENKGPHGQTTADVFYAGDKLNSCIHRYMIKEAIADGNVLRFSVEFMRSLSIRGFHDPSIDADSLDDDEYCKRHKLDLNSLYHSDERIAAVSEDILGQLDRHTRLTDNNVYTAIFAIDKIDTLVKYYKYMKGHNPKGYKIAAIFTYQANQDMEESPDKHAVEYLTDCMNDYNEMFGTDYDPSKFDAYRKDISKRMKQKELPQIDLLLVVNMFLTGFDSKPTNTLFLDKNLVWHSLLQAYSRTNRVDKITKEFGQIITYRNIKKAQDDALRLFSGDGNPDEYLLQSYDYYVKQYWDRVEGVRAVAPTVDRAGMLQSEDDIRRFVLAFRSLAGTLSTLKTFSKFDWADLAPTMDEDEYSDYKSWYLHYYEKKKKDPKSILVDVDFNIELVRTDKINVVYILNLLKEINRSNSEEMSKSIDLILREIERSDNEKLRYKKDIMTEFVTTRFFELDPDEDIMEAYFEYEKERLQAFIEEFSHANSLDTDFTSRILHQYFANTKGITRDYLRQELNGVGVKGILKITKMIEKILEFMTDCYNIFTAEGE